MRDPTPDRREEEHEAHHRGHLHEPERVVELGRVDEAAKRHERAQHVDLRDEEVLQHVAVRPVADLVPQHRHELSRAHLVDQRVEHDDALVVEEAVHVRVRVRRPLRPVDDVELGQRELALLGELVDRGLEEGRGLKGEGG